MGKICYASVETPKTEILEVLVGADELTAGMIIVADSISAAIAGNFSVRTATKPATANLGKVMCLVLSGGNFETLSDGRRPAGNPNYGTYAYKTGDIAPVLLLNMGNKVWMSNDTVSGVIAKDALLEPVDASYVPTIVASRTTGTHSALKIMALKAQPFGGQFGGEFEAGFFAEVTL